MWSEGNAPMEGPSESGNTAGFEDGKSLQARNVDKPWNGEEMYSPLEPPEWNAALPNPVRPKPDFSPTEILGGKICFP